MATATKTAQPVFEAVGGPFSDKDAGIIGPILLQLERDHGEVTKELVLEEAQRESSPLHKHYIWDEAKAAHQNRLDTAAQMIRSIKIIVETTGGELVKTRLMVNVNQNGRRVYRSVNAVIADDDLCSQVIAEARTDLLQFKAKYESYRKMFRQFREQFTDVFGAIERL